MDLKHAILYAKSPEGMICLFKNFFISLIDQGSTLTQAKMHCITPSSFDLPIIPSLPVSNRVYDFSLDFRVPMTVAILYVTAACAFQRRSGDLRTEAGTTSQNRGLFWLTITHNSVLAIYSAASFIGFATVVWFVFRTAWTAGNVEQRVGRVADVLCHVQDHHEQLMNGSTAAIPLELRHVWRDGVATYGWFFYMSKIYELADTFVLVSRGKSPGLFQIYHHTGALLCVWAGLVLKATPLWSFIFMNCGIHAAMVSSTGQ